jgi:hypothetical protein
MDIPAFFRVAFAIGTCVAIPGYALEMSAAPRQAGTVCQDVQSGDFDTAFNSLPVVQQSLGGLGYRWNRSKSEFIIAQAEFKAIAERVVLVLPPAHGTVARVDGPYPLWQYKSSPGYTGTDRVIFRVRGNGREVALRYNLLVVVAVNERQDGKQDCDAVSFEKAA